MPKTYSITQERLKELLSYEPETGDFVWLQRPSNRIRIGDVAGHLNSDGYILIGIDGVVYKAHRLAFMDRLGYMPVEVDHDNHVRHDNRWINLNAATRTTNSKNHTLRCTNTSGTCGIYLDKRRGKWVARAMVDGENVFLGYFTEKSDAIAARQAADIKYGFHTNHGK